MSATSLVVLNVGGQIFNTTVATLCKEPHSLLADLVLGRHPGDEKCDTGMPMDECSCPDVSSHNVTPDSSLTAVLHLAVRDKSNCRGVSSRISVSRTEDSANLTFFIDRDGSLFHVLLNYLRTDVVIIPERENDVHRLLQEAEFYRLETPLRELKKALNLLEFNDEINWNDDGIVIVDKHMRHLQRTPSVSKSPTSSPRPTDDSALQTSSPHQKAFSSLQEALTYVRQERTRENGTMITHIRIMSGTYTDVNTADGTFPANSNIFGVSNSIPHKITIDVENLTLEGKTTASVVFRDMVFDICADNVTLSKMSIHHTGTEKHDLLHCNNYAAICVQPHRQGTTIEHCDISINVAQTFGPSISPSKFNQKGVHVRTNSSSHKTATAGSGGSQGGESSPSNRAKHGSSEDSVAAVSIIERSCILVEAGAAPLIRHDTIHNSNCIGVLFSTNSKGRLESSTILQITARAGVIVQAGADPMINHNTIHSCLAIPSPTRSSNQSSPASPVRHHPQRAASSAGSPTAATRTSPNSTSFATTDTSASSNDTKKKGVVIDTPNQMDLLYCGGIGVLCEEFSFGTIKRNDIFACQRCNLLIGTPSRVVFSPDENSIHSAGIGTDSNVILMEMVSLRSASSNISAEGASGSSSEDNNPKNKKAKITDDSEEDL